MALSAVEKSKRIIFLWSTRRVLSTALQRAIFQLDGIRHICEPFCLPYYFGDNRRSVQFQDKQDLASFFDNIPSDAETLENITADHSFEGTPRTFIKDHALHAWPDKVPHDVLCSAHNTFIIRNPTKAIKSLYRQTLEGEVSMFERFVPEEVGFFEQWKMYDLITNELGQKALVIDADDLMADPKEMLIGYCAFTGLQYDNRMLDWNNDKDIDQKDKPWNFAPDTWSRDVNGTTGFRSKDKVQDEGIVYPKQVENTIDEAMHWYRQLHRNRLQLLLK